MIMVGIGANLDSLRSGAPIQTCAAAVSALGAVGVSVVRRSRWYRSAPVPVSDQPPFVNGVIEVIFDYGPEKLLLLLHAVESEFGRERELINSARVLDLDLLTYDDEERNCGAGLILPHPRMHERAFVLRPFIELAPHWYHPTMGLSVSQLIALMPPGQIAEPIESGSEREVKF